MALSKKLLEFQEKAWAHEVVVASMEVNSVDELLTVHWNIDENADGYFVHESIPEDSVSLLLVEFDFDGKCYEAAFCEELDLVFLGENIGIGDDHQEQYFEFQGTMKTDGFWSYLDSMPNKYKYMIEDSTGRSEYWKRN